MAGRKELLAPENNDVLTIDEHIKSMEPLRPTEERLFAYNLSEKATKAKLIKGCKRDPFLLEENSSSSNLVFSAGSWYNVVMPAVEYWNMIKEDQTCQVGECIITIGGIKMGKENNGKCVDTQIVFLANRDKITCHFYNTTQLILVNGHGYQRLIDTFLKPFFLSQMENCLEEINSYNEFVLAKLGNKTVKKPCSAP